MRYPPDAAVCFIQFQSGSADRSAGFTPWHGAQND
jgi:hypothetical protein